MRDLQRRWGLESNNSVRNFLANLAEEGMIKYSRNPTFASREEAVAHFSAQSVAQPVAQSVAQPVAQSVAHFWKCIRICNYESYQGMAAGSLHTFEHTSLHGSRHTSLHEPLHETLRKTDDSHLFNNKEYKESKDSVVVGARACEEEKVGEEACAAERPRQTEEIPFDEEAFWKWVWEDAGETLWGAARRELGADGRTLARWMDEVRRQWKSSGVSHTGHENAVNHLLSTLRKKAAAAAAAKPPSASAQSRREQARRELRRAAAMEPEPDLSALSGREIEEIWVEAEEVS